MLIEASVLSADFWRLGEQLSQLEAAGIDRIHLDVMDGSFVPNISVGLPVAEALKRNSSLPQAVHLMIQEPSRYVEQFVAAGAALIWVHIEACPHVHRDLQYLRSLGIKAGVSLNPGTPVEALADVLELSDSVLVMSVNPGFGGQTFIPTSLSRIRRLRELIDRQQTGTEIAVDGGINGATAACVLAAGADTLIIGSALFNPLSEAAALLSSIRGLDK